MATAVNPSHIRLDDRGRAWIDDTNTKVIEVVLDKIAQDSTPEEIRSRYPHLSMGQIHAAPAFYHDNQPVIDEEIERSRREIEAMRSKAPGQVTRQELLDRLGAAGSPG